MSSFYGVELKSRLLLGTSRYPSPAVLERAVKASGVEVVTVSLRRESGAGRAGQAFWSLIQSMGVLSLAVQILIVLVHLINADIQKRSLRGLYSKQYCFDYSFAQTYFEHLPITVKSAYVFRQAENNIFIRNIKRYDETYYAFQKPNFILIFFIIQTD